MSINIAFMEGYNSHVIDKPKAKDKKAKTKEYINGCPENANELAAEAVISNQKENFSRR